MNMFSIWLDVWPLTFTKAPNPSGSGLCMSKHRNWERECVLLSSVFSSYLYSGVPSCRHATRWWEQHGTSLVLLPLRQLDGFSFKHALEEFTRLKGNKMGWVFMCLLLKILCRCHVRLWMVPLTMPQWDDLTSCKIYCNPSLPAKDSGLKACRFPFWQRQTQRPDSHVYLQEFNQRVLFPPQAMFIAHAFCTYFLAKALLFSPCLCDVE